ncbi:MAG: hypothetical protein Q9201_000012 [Fulgogasparrea decipioides]
MHNPFKLSSEAEGRFPADKQPQKALRLAKFFDALDNLGEELFFKIAAGALESGFCMKMLRSMRSDIFPPSPATEEDKYLDPSRLSGQNDDAFAEDPDNRTAAKHRPLPSEGALADSMTQTQPPSKTNASKPPCPYSENGPFTTWPTSILPASSLDLLDPRNETKSYLLYHIHQ